MKKITIIGGSGFVGTNLCQALADRGVPFEIVDIKESRRFPDNCKIGDVRDIASLKETVTGDLIVNLAAVHRDDVRDTIEYYRTNVEGAKNIVNLCIERGIKKVVFTSTVAVYGFAAPGTDEDGAINPFNEYGRTKFLAEEELRRWQSSTSSSLIIIRPTVIFGEGNRGNVYNLLKQIASGKFIMIGSGCNRKSMAYIANVVAFIERCIEADRDYALFNYVDTPDFDMNTLVRQVRYALTGKEGVGMRLPFWLGFALARVADVIARTTGRNLSVSSIRVKKFCNSTVFSSRKGELEDFVAPFSLKQGLDRTLQSEFISPDPRAEIFYTE